MRLKLSDNLIKGYNKRNIKAKDLVSFVLTSIPGAYTLKDLDNTALADVVVNDKNIVSAFIDSFTKELVIDLL